MMSFFLCNLLVLFALVEPGTFYPPLAVYRPYLILAIITIIFFFLGRGTLRSNIAKLPQSKYVIFLIIVYTVSEAQYFWLTGTVETFLFWFKKGIVFYLLVNIIDSEKQVKQVMWTLVFAVGYLAYYALSVYWWQDPTLGNTTWGRLETCSAYNNPNSFALVLTLITPLTLKLIEYERLKLIKILLFAIQMVFAFCIILTASRGGIMGFCLAVALSIFMSKKIFKPLKLIVIGVAIGFIIFYGSMQVGLRRDAQTFLGGDVSAGDRLQAWVAAKNMFISNPLFGVGYGHFRELSKAYGTDESILAHNTLISVAAETGIFGITCFVCLLYVCFKQLIHLMQHYKNARILILVQGIFISMVCFMFNTMFSVKDHEPFLWFLFAITASLTYLTKYKPQETLTKRQDYINK